MLKQTELVKVLYQRNYLCQSL